MVRDFPVDKELELWTIDQRLVTRAYAIDEQTGERRFQAIAKAAQAPTITVKFEQDPQTFNQVILYVRSRPRRTFRLHLLREDEVVLSSAQVALRPRSKMQQVVFEFPGQAKESEPITGLTLAMSAGPKEATLYRIQLVNSPPLAHIAGSAGALELNTLGVDARRSMGLSSLEPLEARIPASYRGQVGFSLGMFKADLRRSHAPQLKVAEMRGQEVVQEQTFSFGPKKADPTWQEGRIKLSSSADADTRFRFRLVNDKDREIVCILGQPQLLQAVEQPATVVLITSDTHRADYLGASNSGVDVRTPFLDALAARGVLFTDCVSPTNITNPSHIAMMTGTPARDTGILDNTTPVAEQALTLAESFRDAGYVTYGAISATHLSPERSGLGQGFDRVTFPLEGEVTRDSVETMGLILSWLDQAAGRPLFLWLHLFDAHGPYDAPEDYNRPYYSANKDPYDSSLPELHKAMRPHWNPKVRDLNYIESLYRGEISYLDAGLEEFLSQERFTDAVIGFTSDHGEWLMGPQHYFGHTALSPSTLNVPMILAWPGAPQGLRVDDSVQNLDLGRTLLDLAGLGEVPFPGENLVYGEPVQVGVPRFAMEAGGKSASIRTDRWFLVLSLRDLPASGLVPAIEKHAYTLYDFVVDPLCQHDLREQEEQVAIRLRAALLTWLQSASRYRWGVEREVSQAEISQLAQLGYSDAPVGVSQGRWIKDDCACEWCATVK